MLRNLIASTLFSALLLAAPAFQGERTFVQNDGSSFQAQVKGDEYLHWTETKNGDVLIYNKKSKNHDFAIIQNSELAPSGEMYTDQPQTQGLRSAPTHHKISKEGHSKLWQQKRQQGLNR